MFKSWAMEAGGGLTERQDRFDPASGRTLGPRACNHCRVKKLKCTGNRSGCQRCKDLSRSCNYDQQRTGSQQKPRSRKTRHQDSSSGPKADHHDDGELLASFPTNDGDGASTSLRVELSGSKGAIEQPVKQLEHMNRSSSQARPQVVGTQPSYSTAPFLYTPSKTGASVKSCTFGDENVASPFHLDDFMGVETTAVDGADAHSILSDLVTLEDLHGNFQQSTPANSQENASGKPPTNDDSFDGARKAQEMPQQLLQTSSEVPYILAHGSNETHSSAPCLCLHRIILLMDEVESILGETAAFTDHIVAGYTLDVVLATYKEALRHGEITLDCKHCATSIETMIILTFLIEKLACVCHRIVVELGNKGSNNVGIYQISGSFDISCNNLHCGFGSYEVESWEEFRFMFSGLLDLQLRGLRTLLKQLVDISRRMNSDTMARRLAVTERLMTHAFSLLPPRTE